MHETVKRGLVGSDMWHGYNGKSLGPSETNKNVMRLTGALRYLRVSKWKNADTNYITSAGTCIRKELLDIRFAVGLDHIATRDVLATQR